MDPALLVVDVQQGFDDADYWGPRNNPACEANIAALIAHWRERRLAARLRPPRLDRGARRRCGRTIRATRSRTSITGEPDVLVSKHTNSCFYGEPDLHGWLQERGIDALVLCGITTNHCCETTARMGGNLGYDVRFVLDATHTFDRGDLTADQLAHATATNLNGEFATVVATAEVLDA